MFKLIAKIIAKVIQNLLQIFCRLFIYSIQNIVTFYITAHSKTYNIYYINDAIVILRTS